MSGYVTTGNYEVVDYVENLGGNYFDTGFIPNQDTRVRCKVKILSITNNNCSIFGSGQSYQTNTFEVYLWDQKLEFNYRNTYTFGDTVKIGDVVEIDFNKNIVKYKINGGDWKTITFTYGNFTTPGTMYVFLNHRPTSITTTGQLQLEYFEVYDNGELIRNYKPVVNIHTGEIGVYETLNEEPVTLLGTGTLVPGEPTGEFVDTKTSTRLKVNASRDITQLDYDLAECEDGWFSKYTRVNYLSDYKDNIINSSTIRTDISHDQIGYYDITFQYNEASFNCVIGSNNNAGNKYICWYSNQLCEGSGSNVVDTNDIIGHVYRFVCKKGTNQSVAYKDGVLFKTFTSSFWDSTTNKLHLLGMPGYSGGKNFIYQCEFRTSEYGEVLGKFIPCIRNSDSHAGFYDMVTKNFYEPGSGSFYPGPIESHFDYQKFHMYCARPIYQIDIDIADKIDGWFGDYIRCDYIESTSQQYIDTRIYPYWKNFKIEVRGIQQQSRSLFGTNHDIDMMHLTGNGASFFRYCSYDALGTYSYLSGIHTWIVDTGKCYVDGVEKLPSQTVIPDRTSTLSVYLFGRNKNNTLEDSGAHTIYYCKIWNNGELVRDYIPCIRRSDLKAGLYDLVGKEFYTSSNGYDFIPGGNQYEFNFIKY